MSKLSKTKKIIFTDDPIKVYLRIKIKDHIRFCESSNNVDEDDIRLENMLDQIMDYIKDH